MKNNFIKVVAFTLAETLVVMGIIGVVAALTIPNLNQSTGDREKVAKLKKVYANLEDAYGRATAVYGPVETWFANDGDDDEAWGTRFTDRLTEFMKVSKRISYYEFDLADGTNIGSFIEYPQQTNCSHYENAGYFGSIYVDIDGANKGKNKHGYDRFEFEITDQGILPSNTEYYEDGNGIVSDSEGGYYATAWVIQNGNMDYLKCADELSWSGQTTCK